MSTFSLSLLFVLSENHYSPFSRLNPPTRVICTGKSYLGEHRNGNSGDLGCFSDCASPRMSAQSRYDHD